MLAPPGSASEFDARQSPVLSFFNLKPNVTNELQTAQAAVPTNNFVMIKMQFNYNTYLKKRPLILFFRSVVGGLISDRTGRRKPLVIVSCEYCLSLSPFRDRIVLNFSVQLLDISESITSRRQVKLKHHCYQFTDEQRNELIAITTFYFFPTKIFFSV